MSTLRRAAGCCTVMIAVGTAWLCGCADGVSPTERRLRQQVDALELDRDRCLQELADHDAQIALLHRQIENQRHLKGINLDDLFVVDRIELVSRSGGADYDDQPGDDGITVYLKPLDRDGDAVKVAGDIRIELYDLANPSGQKLIGEYVVAVDQASTYWYGKFATYHYTVRCPWQQGLPKHNEITIRATFVDYLTQRVMTAQTVCTVELLR